MRDSKQQQHSWAGGGRRVSWAHFKNAAHNRQCSGQACAAVDMCAAHLYSAAPLRSRGTERCETPSCRGTRWAAQRQQQVGSSGSAARDVKRAEQMKSNCPLVQCERGKSSPAGDPRLFVTLTAGLRCWRHGAVGASKAAVAALAIQVEGYLPEPASDQRTQTSRRSCSAGRCPCPAGRDANRSSTEHH